MHDRGLSRITRPLVIVLVLHCLNVCPLAAQTITNLHHFAPLDSFFINKDGAYPAASLVLSGGTLYGTTSQGGASGSGTIFKVGTNGIGFAVIYTFTASDPTSGTNGDGAFPLAGLVTAGNSLYGTTSGGGSGGNGTVFKVNSDGSGFAALHGFTATDPNTGANNDGAAPSASLVLTNGILYGTATRGGDAGSGTIFKINTDGTGFARLYSFTALDASSGTNSDGAYPLGGLLVSGNSLFGTTYRGGSLGTGTVFRINFDGSAFTKLRDLDGGPRGGLVLLSNTLYGTTESGGTLGGGTVFRINADGTGFTNLENFSGSAGNGPWAGLTVSSNTLYGTTYLGGDLGHGSIFQINVDGSGFRNVYSFGGGSDGDRPQAAVLAAFGLLYGTTSEGGNSGDGTVFSFTPGQSSGQLAIARSGANVILTWPASTLSLQSTTNFVPKAVWTPVTPAPTLVNGQAFVTNPISGTQKFFRLSQ